MLDGRAQTLVLSGGQGSGEPEPEAVAMQQVAEERLGADKQPIIILESGSKNTYENIHNTRKLIPEAHSIVIVSDVFHLARGVALARRAGFRTVYWDAPRPSYYCVRDLVFYTVREAVGLIVYIPKLITN